MRERAFPITDDAPDGHFLYTFVSLAVKWTCEVIQSTAAALTVRVLSLARSRLIRSTLIKINLKKSCAYTVNVT